jgi:hypothetical protein
LPTPFNGLDNFSRATLFVESIKEKTMMTYYKQW